jgi:quercetin dioxygenase-like cupin family protein
MSKPVLRTVIVAFLTSVLMSYSVASFAQLPGIILFSLLKSSVNGDDTKEATVISMEIAPGAGIPRHTHPGDEYATVVEGLVEVRVAGQEPKRFTAGQAYHNPRGVVHEARNVGDGFARLIITFVVDKNQPLTTLVPSR